LTTDSNNGIDFYRVTQFLFFDSYIFYFNIFLIGFSTHFAGANASSDNTKVIRIMKPTVISNINHISNSNAFKIIDQQDTQQYRQTS
jgi:hypothetical protein